MVGSRGRSDGVQGVGAVGWGWWGQRVEGHRVGVVGWGWWVQGVGVVG